MRSEDADRIIGEVFGKRWPKWEMDAEEIRLWRAELIQHDYDAAVAAVNNFYMSVATGRKPIAAHLAKALKAARKRKGGRNEPRHIFTLVKESNIGKSLRARGYRFAINEINMPKHVEETEELAEKCRQRVLEQMPEDENLVVVQEWGEFYDDQGKLIPRQEVEPKEQTEQEYPEVAVTNPQQEERVPF